MRTLFFLSLLVFCAVTSNAQTKRTLVKVSTELAMKKKLATDGFSGTRGAGVAWHPIQKKYYAVMSGNTKFPASVFDEKGNRISSDNLTTMADCRGLWYNSKLKRIEGNQYSDNGWFSYKLDAKGIPSSIEVLNEEQCQPSAQSTGVYDAKSNSVYFILGSELYKYNHDVCQLKGKTVIHLGVSKKEDIPEDEDITEEPFDYNKGTLIYTGIKKAELGFLNILWERIELYDKETGFLTMILDLPEGAPEAEFFNFAYANNIFWLFDEEARTWLGYK